MQRPNNMESRRLSALGWRRAVDRAGMELALVGLRTEDRQQAGLDKLRASIKASDAVSDNDSRLELARQVDKFLAESYRDVPQQLRDWTRSTRYDVWRRAETAIRLADARDQREIARALRQRTGGAWSDPIADVPLRAVPERVSRYQLAIGEGGTSSGDASSGDPIALSFKVPRKLVVRFESNEPFSAGQTRLKLAYPASRVEVKNAQGTQLVADREWPVGPAGSGVAREHRLELAVASLDEKGQRSDLRLTWLDQNDRELSQAIAVLTHPEPVFSQLAVYGQPGTADHSWRKTVDEKWCFDVPFDDAGLGSARLLTFSGQETAYDFRLTNNANHPKKYTVTIYGAPKADESNPDRTASTLAKTAVDRGAVLAQNELSLPAGGSGSIPFFPAEAAAKEPAASAPAEKSKDGKDDQKGSGTADQPDVSSGMVCLLAEQTKSADGKDLGPGRQQVIVIQVKSQYPSNYITPRVNYDAKRGEIAASLVVPYIERLPPAGSKVEIEVVTTEPLGKQDPTAKRETRLTATNPDDTLRVFVATASDTPAQVFLHVDNYPRAFIYELPLDASLPNVERRLYELRRIDLPQPSEFPLYRGGTVAEPVRFPVQFDMPPSPDRSVFARVFIDQQPGGEFNRLEDREVLKSFDDRVHQARLVKPADAPGMSIRTLVSDFIDDHAPLLDLRAYQNQPVHVRAQLVRIERGREEVLSGPGGVDRAEQTLVLYLDGEAPTLVAQGPTRPVDENEKFRIDLYPRDEVTAVEKVEYAIKVQRDPESKDPNAKMLVEPLVVPRPASGAYQLVHAFEKAGRPSLWFQATDKSGNKSEIQEVAVTVLKPTDPAAGAANQPPPPKLGQITGRATLPDGARGQIRSIVLSDASGKPIKTAPNSGDGSFTFDRLAPGAYTVDAKGFIGGNESKPNPVSVTVEAGKTAGPITVELSR
jgi:hypothetical protein